MQSRNLNLTLAALVGMTTLPSFQAQAGLLDFLFGRSPAPRIEMPFEMTVRPQRQRSKPRVLQDGGAKLSTPINPKEHPDWYLTDPTLRRGDVLVLPNKVLVYSGGRGPRQLADFDELGSSRLISARERARIKGLTEYSGEALAKYKIVPDRASTPVSATTGADKTVSIILP